MKKLALVLAALAVALPAAAQQSNRDSGRAQIGVGISITPLELAGRSRTIEVYVPIQLSAQLRLEPSLGIFSVDQPGNGTDERDVTLGLGLFYVARSTGPVDLYMGGRMKLNFARISVPGASDSGTDLVLAAALGGEYYLAPRFSLGLEGQLGIYSNSNVSGDNSGVFTTGLAFLRVYF